jgi:hypothetical protein
MEADKPRRWRRTSFRRLDGSIDIATDDWTLEDAAGTVATWRRFCDECRRIVQSENNRRFKAKAGTNGRSGSNQYGRKDQAPSKKLKLPDV